MQETLPPYPPFKRQTWKVSPVLSLISATRRLRQKNLEFEASLCYIVEVLFKQQKTQLGIMAHTCNPSTVETETRGPLQL